MGVEMADEAIASRMKQDERVDVFRRRVAGCPAGPVGGADTASSTGGCVSVGELIAAADRGSIPKCGSTRTSAPVSACSGSESEISGVVAAVVVPTAAAVWTTSGHASGVDTASAGSQIANIRGQDTPRASLTAISSAVSRHAGERRAAGKARRLPMICLASSLHPTADISTARLFK
jgi:hypothetical protein